MRASKHRGATNGAGNGSGGATPRVEGLRYTTDREPGIRRIKRGRGFAYVLSGSSSERRAVTDTAVLARIRSLAIPPAYRDVWICPQANGHLQDPPGERAQGRLKARFNVPQNRVSQGETYRPCIDQHRVYLLTPDQVSHPV